MTSGVRLLREVAAYKRNAGDQALANRLEAVADEIAAAMHRLAVQLAIVLGDIDEDWVWDLPPEGWGEEGGVVPAHPSYRGTDG